MFSMNVPAGSPKTRKSQYTIGANTAPRAETSDHTQGQAHLFFSSLETCRLVVYSWSSTLVAANEREGGGGGGWRGTVEGGYGDIGETTEVEATHRPDEEDGAGERWDPGTVLDEWDETDDPPSGRN